MRRVLARTAGVALAAVAVAGAFWGPKPHLPEPAPSTPGTPTKLAAPEPRVVAVARAALERKLPARLRYAGRAYELERLGGGKAIVCDGERACALVSRAAERILIVGGPGARAELRAAAREGEPR